MGYFKRTDPKAHDKELYDRVFKRYLKLYPEAKDADFEPNFSGHDYDWDEIWEEEYQRMQDELANTPYGPKPPPPKKKKKKKPKKDDDDDIIILDDDDIIILDDETTDPIGKCSKPPEDHASKQCNFDTLVMDLGGKNMVTVDLKKAYTRPYEVVCGKKSKAKTLAIQLQDNLTGPCDTHSNRVFFVVGNEGCYEKVGNDNVQLELEYYSSVPNIVPLMVPLILPRWEDVMLEHKPEKVKALIAKCGRSTEVELLIYPDFETSVEFAFGVATKEVSKHSDDFFNFVDGSVASKTTRSLKFKHSFNGNTVEYGGEIEKSYKNSLKIFTIVTRIGKFFGESVGGVFSVILLMPECTIKGSWKYEQTKEYKVVPTGTFKATIDPIIGLDFKVDLLKAGLMCAGVPPFIADLPKKVEEWSGGRAKIELDFYVYVRGKVSLEVSKQFAGKSDFSIVPKASLAMGAKIGAKGEVNLIIKVSAEASASAVASFSLLADIVQLYMPKGKVDLQFDGIKLSLLARYEAGIGWFKTAGEVTGEWIYLENRKITGFDFDLND